MSELLVSRMGGHATCVAPPPPLVHSFADDKETTMAKIPRSERLKLEAEKARLRELGLIQKKQERTEWLLGRVTSDLKELKKLQSSLRNLGAEDDHMTDIGHELLTVLDELEIRY